MVSALPSSAAYGWLMLAGIAVSLVCWWRLARRDSRLVPIYIGALVGAFFGAKLVYLFAEGWLHFHDPNRWVVLATGKSILGALLGGYAGVEAAKKLVGYRSATGDLFALIAPIGIMLGRVGCIMHGCCLGQVCEPGWFTVSDAAGAARWPAAHVELLFNLAAFCVLVILRRSAIFKNQLFHVYLIAYGLFRFAHEFWRETPRLLGPISGYQIAALAVAALGAIGFAVRSKRAAVPELASDAAVSAGPAV
jgi:phosphatidylglycerol:prolipoprotein diacylglycerol transferase